MKRKNRLRALSILGIYLLVTCVLILSCYCIQKPGVQQQEFPFTITYSYQGKTETISDVYVAEYVRAPKYIGDEDVSWYGYIKDRNRLEADFYRVGETADGVLSINLNIEAGYVMGDPRYAGTMCQPTGVYQSFDENDENDVTDPAQLERMGLVILGWEYPYPLDNSFSFGGVSLSSEATLLTSALAVCALLACMFLIKKRKKLKYGILEKITLVFNFIVALVAFPIVLITCALSEIVADASVLQQVLYLAPALTVLGVAASVTLRRMGYKWLSFLVQFVGPVVFRLILMVETI